MKRIRAQVEITRRTYVAVEVDDDLDDEEIKRMAIEEAELAERQDAPQRGYLLRCWRSHDPRRNSEAERRDS
jgi:muconolactone delta-isomerase